MAKPEVKQTTNGASSNPPAAATFDFAKKPAATEPLAFVLLVPGTSTVQATADLADYYTKALKAAGIPVSAVLPVAGLTAAQVIFADGTVI